MEHGNEIMTAPESADKLGIIISSLCFIHCMATPLIVAFLPSISHLWDSFWVHTVLFLVIFPLAFWTLLSRYRIHREKLPIILGGIGLMVLSIGLVVSGAVHHGHEAHHAGHDHMSLGSIEKILTMIGGSFLAIGHLVNLRKCQCYKALKSGHAHGESCRHP